MSNEPLSAGSGDALSASGTSARLRPAAAGPSDPSAWRQLLIALGCAVAALAVRWMIDPWIGERQPYTPAFAAVALAGWFGTWRAGLMCAIVSNVAANVLFVAPRGQFSLSSSEVVGSASYFVITAVILYLGHRAGAANHALRSANLRLREADRHRSEFLATLAHELRSPLSAIRTAGHVLGSGRAGPGDAARAGAALQRQVDVVLRLMDDLMDAARIEQGKITLRRERVPLRKVVDTALDAAQGHLMQRGQHALVEVPEDIGEIVADQARIVQVLTNLLHNAAKFSPAGAAVSLSARREPGCVCIRIVDRGQGIPPERVEWIFGSFSQLQPGSEGLGLGLALVRKLVEMHGGSVQAHSDGLGQGASFEVRLPA